MSLIDPTHACLTSISSTWVLFCFSKIFSPLVVLFFSFFFFIERSLKHGSALDEGMFSTLDKMESLQNKRAERWGDKMDKYASERERLAQQLTTCFENLEQETGIFLIKPVYSFKGRRVRNSSFFQVLPLSCPIQIDSHLITFGSDSVTLVKKPSANNQVLPWNWYKRNALVTSWHRGTNRLLLRPSQAFLPRQRSHPAWVQLTKDALSAGLFRDLTEGSLPARPSSIPTMSKMQEGKMKMRVARSMDKETLKNSPGAIVTSCRVSPSTQKLVTDGCLNLCTISKTPNLRPLLAERTS